MVTVLPSGVFHEMLPLEVDPVSSPIFFCSPASDRLIPSPVSYLNFQPFAIYYFPIFYYFSARLFAVYETINSNNERNNYEKE